MGGKAAAIACDLANPEARTGLIERAVRIPSKKSAWSSAAYGATDSSRAGHGLGPARHA